LLITPKQSDIANGMRMIKARCEEYIRNEDHYKEQIARCDTLLPNFDPLYKQTMASEARFTEMQSTIDKQAQDIAEMKDMITKLLEK
jgi:DNA repair exonuclease SbcCD ATPase subunit